MKKSMFYCFFEVFIFRLLDAVFSRNDVPKIHDTEIENLSRSISATSGKGAVETDLEKNWRVVEGLARQAGLEPAHLRFS